MEKKKKNGKKKQMKKRKEIQKRKMKKIIEFVGIRIIAFFIFNLPILFYCFCCYLTSNI